MQITRVVLPCSNYLPWKFVTFLYVFYLCVCCSQAASAPEGDSALQRYGSTTTPPASQTAPPSYTSPQVPNIHASGSINPTPEQV